VRAVSFLTGRNRRRREKIFGRDYGSALNRDQKNKIIDHAKAWSEAHKRPGQHRGPLTRATMEVLEALLWDFHNAHTGHCFPSYETIAKKAKCAVSTAAKAIVSLEAAGILTWANRLVRLTIRGIPKLIRTSNAYAFNLPPGDFGNLSAPHKMPKPPKSDYLCGTLNQDLSYILGRMESVDNQDSAKAREALKALATDSTARAEKEWLRKREAAGKNSLD